MLPITLDTALNLVWLGVCVAALVLLSILEWHRHAHSTRRARSIRLTAVLIVTVALFPSVSSSDDLFSFSLISSHLGKHGGVGNTIPEDSKEKAGLQLFRLLETLNHYQVTHVYAFFLAWCCVALILTLCRQALTRVVLCRPGRAPPLA